MKACSCGSVIPRGSAYCPGCGRTVGGRKCPACGELSPLGARFCRACGSNKLRDGAPTVSLGFIPRIVAWGIALFLLRAAFAGGLLQRSAGTAFAYVFGRSAGSVAGSAVCVAVTVGLYLVIAEHILGGRVELLRPYLAALGRALSALPKLALWCVRALLWAVEGVPFPSSKKKERRKED